MGGVSVISEKLDSDENPDLATVVAERKIMKVR